MPTNFSSYADFETFVRAYYLESVKQIPSADFTLLMRIQSGGLYSTVERDRRYIAAIGKYMPQMPVLPFDCVFYRGGGIPDARLRPFVSASALRSVAEDFGRPCAIIARAGTKLIPCLALNEISIHSGDPECEVILDTSRIKRRGIMTHEYS